MPHLSIEYSPGLIERADVHGLCHALYDAMVGAGIFPKAGIRVRAYCADYAIVGDGLDQNDFVALTLSVGAGRNSQTLKEAGDLLFLAAQTALAGPLATPHFALSLEIREINPDLSWKDTPIHARLAGQT